MKILFVCTGNICRSPAGEGVLKKMCEERGMHNWTIDSAGTGNWHTGEAPDLRAQEAAHRRGYDISMQKSRPLRADDYEKFDRIYGMTAEHCDFLRTHAPQNCRIPIVLFMESCGKTEDVPDPYYSNERGFEYMMDIIEEGCTAIVAAAQTEN